MLSAAVTPLMAWAWMTSSAAMNPMFSSQDGGEHERRPVEPELAAGLDRLRHAEPGPLGGVQGDQQRADQGADGDRDQRPPEGQPDADGDAAEHDVEHVDVAARTRTRTGARVSRAGRRAGMWSMWRFSTYRRTCSWRAAVAVTVLLVLLC